MLPIGMNNVSLTNSSNRHPMSCAKTIILTNRMMKRLFLD